MHTRPFFRLCSICLVACASGKQIKSCICIQITLVCLVWNQFGIFFFILSLGIHSVCRLLFMEIWKAFQNYKLAGFLRIVVTYFFDTKICCLFSSSYRFCLSFAFDFFFHINTQTCWTSSKLLLSYFFDFCCIHLFWRQQPFWSLPCNFLPLTFTEIWRPFQKFVFLFVKFEFWQRYHDSTKTNIVYMV